MHTQFHVELQFGAEIWATAKPEKKNKVASGTASGILVFGGLEGGGTRENWGRRSKESMD